MKAVVLFKSLTGNTRRAAEYIATDLQQEGWGVTAVCPWNQPEMAAIQEADLVVVGTWVDGLFLVGQKPFAVNAIQHLPAMQGKLAATYCTYAINPGRTLAKLDTAVSALGANVVGGLALHRHKLRAHSEEFAARLVANVPSPQR